jgi:DNA-binding MarR family transcriptional regulator
MEIKNFIMCKQDEKDKRIKIVYLTQKAYDLLEEVKQTKLKVEEQLFKGFDSQQQTDIINNLQILFENTKMEELL